MNYIRWFFNLPYTVFGIAFSILSVPKKISFDIRTGLPVLVIKVHTLKTVFTMPQVRGVTFGSTILLGPLEDANVFEHELVHVEQFLRYPIIFPVLYLYQLARYGYRYAPLEDEAYTRAGNTYKGHTVAKKG